MLCNFLDFYPNIASQITTRTIFSCIDLAAQISSLSGNLSHVQHGKHQVPLEGKHLPLQLLIAAVNCQAGSAGWLQMRTVNDEEKMKGEQSQQPNAKPSALRDKTLGMGSLGTQEVLAERPVGGELRNASDCMWKS